MSTEYKFRLFSYFSMTILSIAILVGIFIILQHTNEEDRSEKQIANQETLIQNQELLRAILDEMEDGLDSAKQHEEREETMLGNNTNTNIKISSSNSERLDNLTKKVDNLTKIVTDMMF